jgi:hypothetical protein
MTEHKPPGQTERWGRSSWWKADLVRQLVHSKAETADVDDRAWRSGPSPGRLTPGRTPQPPPLHAAFADARPAETGGASEERIAAPARPRVDPSTSAIRPTTRSVTTTRRGPSLLRPLALFNPVFNRVFNPACTPRRVFNRCCTTACPPSSPTPTGVDEPVDPAGLNTPVEHLNGAVEHPADSDGEVSPRDRPRPAAVRHAARHGGLPTVSELEALAAVSRGTAAAALKALCRQPTPLHVVPDTVPDTPDPETQP